MNKLQQRIKEYGQQALANDAAVHKSQISQVMNNAIKGFGKESGYRIAKRLKIKLAIAQGLEE